MSNLLEMHRGQAMQGNSHHSAALRPQGNLRLLDHAPLPILTTTKQCYVPTLRATWEVCVVACVPLLVTHLMGPAGALSPLETSPAAVKVNSNDRKNLQEQHLRNYYYCHSHPPLSPRV